MTAWQKIKNTEHQVKYTLLNTMQWYVRVYIYLGVYCATLQPKCPLVFDNKHDMIDSTKALGGRPRLGAQGVLDSRRERREFGRAANTEGKQSTVDKAGPSLVFVAQSTAMAELGEIHEEEEGVCVQERAGEEEPGDISLEKEVDFSFYKEADLSLEELSDQDLVERAFEEEFKSKYDVYM